MNLTLFQRLNELICLQNTGPVDVLAGKLGISSRQVKYIIRKMRQDCAAPIWFDHHKQSYMYTQDGSCDFKFKPAKRELITMAVREAINKCLLWCSLGSCAMLQLAAQMDALPV